MIASDRAEFFDPHVSIGLVSGREMVRLARALPTNIAMRMALIGRHERMSAQRAYELGLVSEVVEHDRLLERAREVAALVNRNAPLAVRGTRLAIRRGLDLPMHEAEVHGRGVPRAGRPHRRRQGGPAGVHREARSGVDGAGDRDGSRRSSTRSPTTTSRRSRSNRPEVLNAFDRRMCEEMRTAWRRVKDDPSVHAVVLRAAGDRAFCAGLDTKKPYGQPDDVWNHEDPGELLSPKWQQVWKPVVCAVQGICTAGAFYFLNEADIVICSDDATFFDSHVTYGLVSALEPVGLMRKVGLAETLRIALSATTSGSPPRPRCASAWSPRSSPATSSGREPTRSPRASPRKPSAATQGTVRAIWESLDRPVPRRDGAGPDLHPARQPASAGRGRRARARDRPKPRLR